MKSSLNAYANIAGQDVVDHLHQLASRLTGVRVVHVNSTRVGGGVAESFEVSDGGATFTFHLRPGLKYSDGVPMTTEDVLFRYEDELLNEDLGDHPAWMKTGNTSGGDPLVVEVVDTYTFKVKFTEPYAGFTAFLAIAQWKGASCSCGCEKPSMPGDGMDSTVVRVWWA